MAARQQAHQRLPDLHIFPDDDLADLGGDGMDPGIHRFSCGMKMETSAAVPAYSLLRPIFGFLFPT
jgi:hypothetical protein